MSPDHAPFARYRNLRLMLCWFLFSGSLFAHDFWLQPAFTDKPQPGPVKVQAFLGDHFQGESIIPAESLVADFWVQDKTGRRPLRAASMLGFAGLGRIETDGLCLIAYQGRAKYLQLPAAKFERYLNEESLHQILAQRRRQATTDQPGREFFSRCAKSLVAVGPVAEVRVADMTAGLPLEITPLDNPFTAKPGDQLRFQLTFAGKPLADQPLVLYRRAPQQPEQKHTTDSAGTVTITVDHQGEWLLKTVYMVPHDQPEQAEWRSYWASLTFANPA